MLVQWALPRGRMRAAQVEGRRQSEFAGSQGVDDLGRRLDDREFKITRNALYEICADHSAYAWRNQAFNPGQVAAQLTDDVMAKRGLPIPHGVTVHGALDGSSFWAVRRTVSGWWLGRGLTLNQLGLVDVWTPSYHFITNAFGNSKEELEQSARTEAEEYSAPPT